MQIFQIILCHTWQLSMFHKVCVKILLPILDPVAMLMHTIRTGQRGSWMWFLRETENTCTCNKWWRIQVTSHQSMVVAAINSCRKGVSIMQTWKMWCMGDIPNSGGQRTGMADRKNIGHNHKVQPGPGGVHFSIIFGTQCRCTPEL